MVFISNFTTNNKDNTYQLIVTTDMKPKLLHFTGYDRMFGSHYDEYTITYSDFTPGKPDSSVFQTMSR